MRNECAQVLTKMETLQEDLARQLYYSELKRPIELAMGKIIGWSK